MSAAVLAPLDIAPRLGRLRARFEGAAIDALLVTKLANVRYLTGFTGSAALLLVTPDDALFVTDGRYTEQSREQLAAAGVLDAPGAGSGVRIDIGLTAAAQHAALAAAVAPDAPPGSRSTASRGPSSAASSPPSRASRSCRPVRSSRSCAA